MEPTAEQLSTLRREAETKLDAVTRDVDQLLHRLDPHTLAEAGRAEVKRKVAAQQPRLVMALAAVSTATAVAVVIVLLRRRR